MKSMTMIFIFFLFSAVSIAAEYEIPNTFQANTSAVAEEVNTNFSGAKVAIDDNNSRIEALESTIEALETLVQELQTQFDELKANSVLALDGTVKLDESAAEPTMLITGVNVQIVNGQSATDSTNGKGNLILGYNEESQSANTVGRGGSHNLIVGPEQTYSSFGGIVAGRKNSISAASASVIGGENNSAKGEISSVLGGVFNQANGYASSVNGGQENEASGIASIINGGILNHASGNASSVNGGQENEAGGYASSVSSGQSNQASGVTSSVNGGQENEASGVASSVNGGNGNVAIDRFGVAP